MTVSVVSFWEIPGLGHLTAFTDTGVSILPDYKTKGDILKNAVFLYHLLGYEKPRIVVTSSERKFGGSLESYRDYKMLRKSAEAGEFGECEGVPATSLTEVFLGKRGRLKNYRDIDLTKIPHVILVPRLDAGNIMCKLDFFLDVTRFSIAVTSRGAVCIPSRADFSDSIMMELAMGVVVADRLEGR
jgi:phosphate butyryltransferase